MVYEGCQGILEDGKMCTLGVTARTARQTGAYEDGPNSQSRGNHSYQEIWEGVHIFCFFDKNICRMMSGVGGSWITTVLG